MAARRGSGRSSLTGTLPGKTWRALPELEQSVCETGALTRVATSKQDDAAPLDPGLLEIMACPDCKSPVAQDGAWIVCQNPACGKRYPIRDGIPVMLVEEAIAPTGPQRKKNS